jgi:hypothetical protein
LTVFNDREGQCNRGNWTAVTIDDPGVSCNGGIAFWAIAIPQGAITADIARHKGVQRAHKPNLWAVEGGGFMDLERAGLLNESVREQIQVVTQ